MEYSWKQRDEEIFDMEGMPRNGICAPGRKGDIYDIIKKTLSKLDIDMRAKKDAYNAAVDRYNEAVDDIKDGYEVDLDHYKLPHFSNDLKEFDFEVHDAIDLNISLAWIHQKKLYIGRLPAPGRFGTVSNSKEKLDIEYFKGANCPDVHISRQLGFAEAEVAQLRYYTESPLFEVGHFACRVGLLIIKVFQIMLAYNESLCFDKHETFASLPLFFADKTNGPLILNALIWLAFGSVIAFATRKVVEFFGGTDNTRFGSILLAITHGILATRTLLGYFAGFVGIMISIGFGVYDLIYLGKTFVRIFKRMSKYRLLPTERKYGVPYYCRFEDIANDLYRYIRLRTIWYETVYEKPAPANYQQAIKKLEKLDKKYQPYARIYRQIMG